MKRYFAIIIARVALMAILMMCVVAANAADYLAGYNNTTKTLTLYDSKVYNGSFDLTCRVLESNYHTEGYERNGLGLSDEIRGNQRRRACLFIMAKRPWLSERSASSFALPSVNGFERSSRQS